jgi:hypothetical protein
MNAFLVPIDVAALLVLWWTAYAALHGGHRVYDWNGIFLNLALIALFVGGFVGAIATIHGESPLSWRARGVIYPSAAIAAWLYDYRFGIARHARMIGGGIRGVFLHSRRGGSTR